MNSSSGGIVGFYAFPRSGATLFSLVISRHPDIIVTPEMEAFGKPIAQKSWCEFIKYLSVYIEEDVSPDISLSELSLVLKNSGKYLFYRIWVPGSDLDGLPIQQLKEISLAGNIFLGRNFFDCCGSLQQKNYYYSEKYHLKLWKIDTAITHNILKIYNKLLLHIDKLTDCHLILHENLIRDPNIVFQSVQKYLQLNETTLRTDALNSMESQNKKFITGDSKALTSTKIDSSLAQRYDYIFSNYQKMLILEKIENNSVYEQIDYPQRNSITAYILRCWKTYPRALRYFRNRMLNSIKYRLKKLLTNKFSR